jgi:ferredoxin-NADP reductase
MLISQVTLAAQAVITIRLVDPDGAQLPEWAPGAHLDLLLPSGRIRQYSLCGDPLDRTCYTVAVLREDAGRGGSVEVHDSTLVGRYLEVRGPRNHFELRPAARYLFLAGGIGVTPLMAMIRVATRNGIPWTLHYGGRALAHMAFRDELCQLGGDAVHLVPQDQFGILDLEQIIDASPVGTDVYCCGPEPMLVAAERACAGSGSPRTIYIERFGAASTSPIAGDEGDRAEFEVELARSGTVLIVPADRTLLDVVRTAVADVPYSCEGGYCGACETRVLEGEPEHHDQILTDAERASGSTMMICVGRARSARLVLDL